MSDNRRSSIVFPLLLILVGTGLLLDQFGLWHPNWEGVVRYWPLLLVLLGLELIARGHQTARVAVAVLAVAAIVLVAVLAWPSVTGGAGLETREITVPVQDMDEAAIRLQLGAAGLDLRSGAPDGPLLQATVTYLPGRTDVALDSMTRQSRGDVLLRGETRNASFLGSGWSAENWQVRLRPRFPIDLTVQAGVGALSLDLADLSLSHMTLQGGVGRQQVLLPDYGSYGVVINGSVGDIDIVIPDGVQARIRIDTGIGAVQVADRYAQEGRYHVSAGYESAAERVDIDIDAGIGRIVVR